MWGTLGSFSGKGCMSQSSPARHVADQVQVTVTSIKIRELTYQNRGAPPGTRCLACSTIAGESESREGRTQLFEQLEGGWECPL